MPVPESSCVTIDIQDNDYNADGELEQTTSFGGGSYKYTYLRGNLDTLTDERNFVSKSTYNDKNQEIFTKDAEGNVSCSLCSNPDDACKELRQRMRNV